LYINENSTISNGTQFTDAVTCSMVKAVDHIKVLNYINILNRYIYKLTIFMVELINAHRSNCFKVKQYCNDVETNVYTDNRVI